MTSDIRFYLINRITGEEKEIDKVYNPSVYWELNEAGTASFTMSTKDPKLINEQTGILFYQDGVMEIKVTLWGRLIWEGRVIQTNINHQGSEGDITFVAREIFYLLNLRRTTASFQNQTLGYTARQLITTTQALTGGNLGITLGDDYSSSTHQRTYNDETIYSAIKSMSEVLNGIDFYFTPTLFHSTSKVFHVVNTRGIERPEILLELVENGKNNVTKWSSEFNLPNIKNSIKGTGTGQSDRSATYTAEDANSIGFYGLFEDRETYWNVSEQATVQKKVEESIARSRVPRNYYEFSVSNQVYKFVDDLIGRFDVGDILTIQVQSGFIKRKFKARVYGMGIKIKEDGEIVLDLKTNTVL